MHRIKKNIANFKESVLTEMSARFLSVSLHFDIHNQTTYPTLFTTCFPRIYTKKKMRILESIRQPGVTEGLACKSDMRGKWRRNGDSYGEADV